MNWEGLSFNGLIKCSVPNPATGRWSPRGYPATAEVVDEPRDDEIPGGHTDSHKHDRPELLYIISGEGVSKGANEETEVAPETVIRVEAHEMHELINTIMTC